MTNTYTLAVANKEPYGAAYSPAQGIPQNMTLAQAEQLAIQARMKGVDCIAFNAASI